MCVLLKTICILNAISTKISMTFFCCCSVTQSCPTLRPHGLKRTRPHCPSPTPGACSDSCPMKLVMPSNHLILSRPLLLLPSIFPSIRVFSNESILHIRWPKYWSFSFSSKQMANKHWKAAELHRYQRSTN